MAKDGLINGFAAATDILFDDGRSC